MGFEGTGPRFNARCAISFVYDDIKSSLCGGFTMCQEFYINSSWLACTITLVCATVEEVEE